VASFGCDIASGTAFPTGTNIVTCTAVDNLGNAGSCSFSVIVKEEDPPEVVCRPAPNPSGKKIPVAGKSSASGQNPDGYFQLLARDNCDPNPLLFIQDSGSSFIAGPFASGDVIKLTQSPGSTPSSDASPDSDVVAHVRLKGDGLLFAVDASDNISDPESCLVPRAPK
jgi:hypothetical protein